MVFGTVWIIQCFCGDGCYIARRCAAMYCVYCGKSETIALSDVSLAVRVHPSRFTGPHTSLRPLRSHLNRRLARSSFDNDNNTNEPSGRACSPPGTKPVIGRPPSSPSSSSPPPPLPPPQSHFADDFAVLQSVRCSLSVGDESLVRRGVKLLLARRPADPARRTD